MPADFEKAVAKLMLAEGGYRAVDAHAGSVNFGITERFVREQLPEVQDPAKYIREITRDAATQIYREIFWDRCGTWRLDDQTIAETHLLATVNTGPYNGTSRLQRATNQMMAREDWPAPTPTPLKVDGLLGVKTAAAVNSVADHDHLRRLYQREMLQYYEQLAERPFFADFLAGWKARLELTGDF